VIPRRVLEERHSRWRGVEQEKGRYRSVVIVGCGGGRRRIRNDELVVCDPVDCNTIERRQEVENKGEGSSDSCGHRFIIVEGQEQEIH